MQKNTMVRNNKIIIFIVFLCAALMMSVFVVHLRSKSNTNLYNSDNTLLFPAPRDLNGFELAFVNHEKFTQKNLYGHWTLIFFGFTHCSEICPTTLSMLGDAYKTLHPAYPNLQVILVSLDPDRDTPQTLAKYAQTFDSNFMGASGTLQNLRKLQSQLGIYSARADGQENYQIQHTSSIMLINPKGQWSGVFKYGMNKDEFIQTFKKSIVSLEAHHLG